jgi:GNAT superfamily N-acetyltransferase
MERCRAALTVDPAAIRAGDVFVATDGDRPVGLHQTEGPSGAVLELVLLYVEPAWIGRGVGRALLHHAATLARRRGAEALSILADPHAAAFYRSQGAIQVGDAPSDAIAGRMLPLFRLVLS